MLVSLAIIRKEWKQKRRVFPGIFDYFQPITYLRRSSSPSSRHETNPWYKCHIQTVIAFGNTSSPSAMICSCMCRSDERKQSRAIDQIFMRVEIVASSAQGRLNIPTSLKCDHWPSRLPHRKTEICVKMPHLSGRTAS